MADRNTLFHASRQVILEDTAVVRSTASHKRILVRGMGNSQAGSSPVIDTRGWDKARWFITNPRFRYFAVETTNTSDDWLAGDNDETLSVAEGGYLRLMNADGTYQMRVRLKQKIVDGTRNFSVWERPTLDKDYVNVDASTTSTNGTQLFSGRWPSNYKPGTGSSGNGIPTGKSYFASDSSGNTTSLGTNSEIIATPSNSNYNVASVQASLYTSLMCGEVVHELIEPWDVALYTEADTHEHTLRSNGQRMVDNDVYQSEQVKHADYRSGIMRGTADGFGWASQTSGYCATLPPFLVVQSRTLNPNRSQSAVCYDLYIDLYRNTPANKGKQLSASLSRGDTWKKDTHE